jgi:hemoglobin
MTHPLDAERLTPPGAQPTSLFEQLGGAVSLRAIIDDFIDRVFADAMIGFMFQSADRQRIKAKEFEFAARHLGATLPYTGRPLPEVHAKHRIMGGQFARRLHILRETLADHGAPEAVSQHWLEHTEKMRPLLTRDRGTDCGAESQSGEEPPLRLPALPIVHGDPARPSERASGAQLFGTSDSTEPSRQIHVVKLRRS